MEWSGLTASQPVSAKDLRPNQDGAEQRNDERTRSPSAPRPFLPVPLLADKPWQESRKFIGASKPKEFSLGRSRRGSFSSPAATLTFPSSLFRDRQTAIESTLVKKAVMERLAIVTNRGEREREREREREKPDSESDADPS